MEETVTNYMMMILYAMIAIVLASIVHMSIEKMNIEDVFYQQKTYDAGNHFYLSERERANIHVLRTDVKKNSEFSALDYIDIYYKNQINNELKDEVNVYGYVNTSECGVYPLTYVIRINDILTKKEVSFVVA